MLQSDFHFDSLLKYGLQLFGLILIMNWNSLLFFIIMILQFIIGSVDKDHHLDGEIDFNKCKSFCVRVGSEIWIYNPSIHLLLHWINLLKQKDIRYKGDDRI